MKLEDIKPEYLGSAKRVIVDKDNTVIVDGAGEKENIEARCNQITKQIENSTSDYDKEKLQERLAKLSGGVAVIKVGGKTEIEVKERKDRVDDAVNATRAALEEGIIPGGGVALLRASVALKTKAWDDSYRYGYNIIQKALRAPIEKILENAGFEPSEIINNILQNTNLNWGYNARTYNDDGTKGYCDMLDEGIIDPVKVTRMAIQNAASVAGLIITTEATIFDEPKKECECSAGAGMGAGMGGMGGMGY